MNSRKKAGRWLVDSYRNVVSVIVALVFVLAGTATCFATTVALQWDAVTDTSLAGYKIYYQADSSVQPFAGAGASQGSSPIDTQSLTSATIGGLDPSHAYYFAVVAYDTAGVESSYSNTVYVPELVAPTVAISSPSSNATVSGTVSVSASASDNVGVTKVEFYINGVLKATDTATPYVYSWNTSALTSATYTVMAKAYDAAGNVGQSSAVSVNVVNDLSAPTVAVTAPVNNATVSAMVTITASASDNVGVSKVEFYENGILLSAGNVSPYTYNWNSSLVANGSYSLTAVAYDNAGNVGQSSAVTVTVFNDTAAPTVTAFTMPATASSTTVSISSFAATDNASVSGYLITESATAPAASAAGWTASVPTSFTFSATGSRTAYAWARDAAGNVSSSRSAAVVITIALPDTTAPLVSMRVRKDSTTVSGILTATVTASDNVGVKNVEFYVNGVLVSTSTTAPYLFNWDSTKVPYGNYILMAKAYDAAGNVGKSGTVKVTTPYVKFR